MTGIIYEYKEEKFNNKLELVEQLNKLGLEGWEFCTIIQKKNELGLFPESVICQVCILKRMTIPENKKLG